MKTCSGGAKLIIGIATLRTCHVDNKVLNVMGGVHFVSLSFRQILGLLPINNLSYLAFNSFYNFITQITYNMTRYFDRR